MVEKKRFSEELDKLIKLGELLAYALQRDCFRKEFDKQIGKDLKKEDVERFVKAYQISTRTIRHGIRRHTRSLSKFCQTDLKILNHISNTRV